MEIDVSDYTYGTTDEMGKDGNSLKPVPQCGFGEGLPYAPVDWPNLGDVWTWKVGNKISPSGYYIHRSLIAPTRLQKIPTKKISFESKLAIIRYLQSEFPKADIDEFFASFTWKIPAEKRSNKKVKKRPSSPRATPMKKRPLPRATTVNQVDSGSQIFRRTRNSTKKYILLSAQDTTTSVDMQLSRADQISSVIANGKNQSLISANGKDQSVIAANGKNQSWGTANGKSKDQASNSHVSIGPVQNAADPSALSGWPHYSKSLADHLAEMTSEEFDIYLNSLDDTLSESVPRLPNSGEAVLLMEDFTKAREELSSLLAIDLPSLGTSNKLLEVKNLSSKLQSDPYLSREEHSMLNLIQEIPLANQVTAEASKSSMELEADIVHISSLKSQYILCKDKIALLQAEDASALSTIQEIDQEITKLQSRRTKLAKAVKRNQKKIVDLVSTQNQVFDSIANIIDDVQMANSGSSQWGKFAPLKGFSFRR